MLSACGMISSHPLWIAGLLHTLSGQLASLYNCCCVVVTCTVAIPNVFYCCEDTVPN